MWVEGVGEEAGEGFMMTGYIGSYFSHCLALFGIGISFFPRTAVVVSGYNEFKNSKVQEARVAGLQTHRVHAVTVLKLPDAQFFVESPTHTREKV